jgi:dienelactone hydrolase
MKTEGRPPPSIKIMKTKFFSTLTIFLAALATVDAQPIPHHFTVITKTPAGDAVLTLDGSVSNMFNLTGTISNQFNQMFDLYPVEVSEDLITWRGLAWLRRTNDNPAPLIFDDTNAATMAQRFYCTYTNQFLTFYPAPTGPFPVGTVDRVMIDPARTNLYRYVPPTNAFMVTFWYPASTPPAGTMPIHPFGKRLAADPTFYPDGNAPWSNILSTVVQESFPDIAIATNPATFPVVLISHGFGNYRHNLTLLAAELASHGYIVIAPDHADAFGTEFPDGTYLHSYSASLHTSDNFYPTNRHQDMTFLVNVLPALNAGDPLFVGRLDLNNIGLFGHSAGGIVIDVARTNSPVKCVAIYDGTIFDNLRLQKPLLVMLGQTNYNYFQDFSLFSLAANLSTFLQIQNADHETCCDFGWGIELPWGRSPNRAIDDCVLWFFDTYLKSETPVFPTSTEIYNVQRK